jgi:hypothetical protein
MADIVKVSAEDMRWIAPERPLVDVVREWHEQGPALVVVTRGARGVYASGPTGHVDLPVVRRLAPRRSPRPDLLKEAAPRSKMRTLPVNRSELPFPST